MRATSVRKSGSPNILLFSDTKREHNIIFAAFTTHSTLVQSIFNMVINKSITHISKTNTTYVVFYDGAIIVFSRFFNQKFLKPVFRGCLKVVR